MFDPNAGIFAIFSWFGAAPGAVALDDLFCLRISYNKRVTLLPARL